jgi:hypothetical protein
MMDLEDWALENAAQLVAHVERHGIAMTWAEARDHLLHAGKCLEIPAYVDHGDGGFVPLGSAVPACQRPDFVEEVAAGVVLGEGRHFFPAYPATAETPIAVPWAMATELVHRLSQLLSERLMDSHGTREDIVGLVDLSLLVARLSGEVSAEMACVPADGDGVCVIDDEPYLLMPACDVWKAATLLREVEGPSATALPVVDPGVVDSHVTAQQAPDTFLWDLDWWLSDRSCHR